MAETKENQTDLVKDVKNVGGIYEKLKGSIFDIGRLVQAGGIEVAQQIPEYALGKRGEFLDARQNAAFQGLNESNSPIANFIKGGGVGQASVPVKNTAPAVVQTALPNPELTETPAAATPSVEAPIPVDAGKPWSPERRAKELGLVQPKIVKGGGPGGTDLLTNRENPFTEPKTLPQEAYGVGGSAKKEAAMRDLEKEVNQPFADRGKSNLYYKSLGIGEGITPIEQAKLDLEKEKMTQSAKQFAITNDMTKRHNQEQIALQLGGFTETEVPDPAGTGTVKVRTPNPEFFKEAFDEKGNFSLDRAMKSVDKSKTFQTAKAKLLEVKGDPKVAKAIKERMVAAGYSTTEIKERLGI